MLGINSEAKALFTYGIKAKWDVKSCALATRLHSMPSHCSMAPPLLLLRNQQVQDRISEWNNDASIDSLPFFNLAAIRTLVIQFPRRSFKEQVKFDPLVTSFSNASEYCADNFIVALSILN